MKKVFAFLISKELWIGAAGSILATILLSIVNGIIPDNWKEIFSFEFIDEFFTQPIPLYWILILVFAISIIIYLRRTKREPAFIKETSCKMGELTWHWRWEYDKNDKLWVMNDYYPLCPDCGKELRMGYGDQDHSCVNGHHYQIQDYLKMKGQIVTDIANKYPKEADKIYRSPYIG